MQRSPRPFPVPLEEDLAPRGPPSEDDDEGQQQLALHLIEEEYELNYLVGLQEDDAETEPCTTQPETVVSSDSESVGLRDPQPLTTSDYDRARELAPGLDHGQAVLAAALQDVALGRRTATDFANQALVVASCIEPGPCARSYGGGGFFASDPQSYGGGGLFASGPPTAYGVFGRPWHLRPFGTVSSSPYGGGRTRSTR